MDPFLCIITPVFDLALPCIELLVAALKEQTCNDFTHVCISNGSSPSVKEFISKQDKKFIYDEIVEEKLQCTKALIANLGRRRESCLRKYKADRYLFLDADIKLLRADYFEQLKSNHEKADIILTDVLYKTWTYPAFPIAQGSIDISNYSFSKKVAKSQSYPTDFKTHIGYANDYRFWLLIKNYSIDYLNIIFAEKDGNNLGIYKRVSEHNLT